MRRTASVGALLAFLAIANAAASVPAPTPDAVWHRLIGILQYLEADYPAAVESQSAFELNEQRAFIREALLAARELGPQAGKFLGRLEAVQAKVDQGIDPQGVSAECGRLVSEIVVETKLVRSPRLAPSLERGAQVYQQSCASCHAADGSGRVPHAATMEPPPAAFTDLQRLAGLSPYKAFNTTTFGIPGTAMAAFPALTEDDRWAVAFYLFTLGHPRCETKTPKVALDELATLTDAELAARYGAEALPCLRRNLPRTDEDHALLAARTGVERGLKAFEGGDFTGARHAILDAYLNGLEPVEPLLRGRDAELVQRLEEAFNDARIAAEQRSPSFGPKATALLALLEQARRGPSTPPSLWSVFWLSFLVVVREGFEAIVVVGALLAVLKKLQRPESARVVHAGWISALVAGAVAYLFGRELLKGANRELMEGVVGLIAVALLIYAALWLNARANIRRFMGELRERMTTAVGTGSAAGLFSISFAAVFRESFETAIFLQGLSIDSPAGAAWGGLAGLVLMVGVAIGVNSVGYRLPMKPLFTASTALLLVTSVILLGKGLHALQEVGLVPLRPVPFFQLDFLGIYPDGFTLFPQLALTVALLAWLYGSRSPSTPDGQPVRVE